jgi:hypothetical protein
MIRTFPFGDLRVCQIRCAITAGLHKPFAAFMVNNTPVDEIPAMQRGLEKLLLAPPFAENLDS